MLTYEIKTADLLQKIDDPADLKSLSVDELSTLAGEIRCELVRTMASNGGHLATNLGSVEITLAMHYVLSSPRDKLLWDVGNQCYTHKLITGRRAQFSTIRQAGGISGFVHRGENPHDHMTAGHSSTALSTALGLATARDHAGDDYRVVAIVGDGAMSAGLSFEALNNMQHLGSQLLLLLNDNDYSIGASCGGMSQTLRTARSHILDGTIFESLGVDYLGPVDGHDIQLLVEVLRDVSRARRPIVLHVLTQKGKGYAPAELSPARFHGVSPFDLRTGAPLKESNPVTYSRLFGEQLTHIAAVDDKVLAITAAMVAGTGLEEFARRFPDRCFDVGIAEQHAVTFAAGLALGGSKPVVAIYSTFLQRAYDQVIHDVCLQNLPVTFVLDRGGLASADGPTHHGVLDFAYLRSIPGMTVMAPMDGEEFRLMLASAIDHAGPAAIRIPRGIVPTGIRPIGQEVSPVEIGRGELLLDGDDVALLAIGTMVDRALDAAEELGRRGVSCAVVNARFVKPLDASLILDIAARVGQLFTIEEHAQQGGFGSAVLELLCGHHSLAHVTVLGLPDRFITHGSRDELLHDCGLSVERIVEQVIAQRPVTHANECEIYQVNVDDGDRNILRIKGTEVPTALRYWVGEYNKVGNRDAFLWKWCCEGARLTTLSSVDSAFLESNNVTKVLGVMVDVLMDDVADQPGERAYLDELLRIPFSRNPSSFAEFPNEMIEYARTTGRVFGAVLDRLRDYPRFDEFVDLLEFDYLQLMNAMRYSRMINENHQLMNLAEHDIYLPHNMHMMASGTIDLMCSPDLDAAEVGAVREVLWHAQCMGRIGNLLTTWRREINEGDFTSGVFAWALSERLVLPDELHSKNGEHLQKSIASHRCDGFFFKRWQTHRESILSRASAIRSVDINQLVGGLDSLLTLHIGSRGLK